MYPKRFSTGIRKTTIANPAKIYSNIEGSEVFEGRVDNYNFKRQFENFVKLQKVLKSHGTKLGPIAAATYWGDTGYIYNYKPTKLYRFVSCSEDGKLMWEKYEGISWGGGQNRVYLGGKRIYLSDFLSMSHSSQRLLLNSKE